MVSTSRIGAFGAVPVAVATGSAAATCAAVSAGSCLGAVSATRELWNSHRAGRAGSTLAGFARAAAPLGLSNLVILVGTRFNTLLIGGALRCAPRPCSRARGASFRSAST